MTEIALDRLNRALEGRYEVERELGEGGMAVVYLADDLRHERKVALKVLKPELAAVVGAERFLAEIKTTANLQHPHILPLFDSGEADGFLFYVMPYIEGETLRDKLDRERQLAVDEALGIATAVANALHTAHEAGVIHRDIKPGNILLSRGEPLVADFGIAIAVGAAGGNRLTETGLSVGTPYYMSPEQATGDQAVGPASDTFALACVLYEMLVGEPPYPGSTAQAVLGKIIQGVPVSATAVRKSIPPNVDAAIRKALEKLPADRFTAAHDFAKALADPGFRHGADPFADASVSGSRWRVAAVAASLVALLLAGGLGASLMAPEPAPPVERFALATVEGQFTSIDFDVSDDGSAVAFSVLRDGSTHLQLRRLGSLDPTPIPGTNGGYHPAISPDGQEIAFLVEQQVKVAPLAGGVIRTLADSASCCTRWGPDGYVYYSNLARVMVRVPEDGGPVEHMTTQLEEGDGPHGDFVVRPDDDMAVFTTWAAPPRVEAIRLSTGERKTVTTGVKPFFSGRGHLVFGSLDGQILAGRFDPRTMELSAPAVPLVEGVRVGGFNYPFFSLSREGTLVYWTGASTSGSGARVVRVDRSGEVEAIDPSWMFDPGTPEVSAVLSPDGRRLAVKISDDEGDGDDIWVKELDDGPLSRVTFDPAPDWRPRWSADGEWIYFISFREGDDDPSDLDLYRRRWNGTSPPEMVLDFDGHVAEAILNPEGTAWILRLGGSNVQGSDRIRDIVGLDVGAPTDATYPLAAEPYDEKAAVLSPDGRWLAYESTETGRDEVYIRPYPNVTDGKWQISNGGGINPKWARSGREIFYIDQGRDMTVAELDLAAEPRVLSREQLFNLDELGLYAQANYASYDVDLDDQHLIMVQFGAGGDDGIANDFVVVQNWLTEVEERLPRR